MQFKCLLNSNKQFTIFALNLLYCRDTSNLILSFLIDYLKNCRRLLIHYLADIFVTLKLASSLGRAFSFLSQVTLMGLSPSTGHSMVAFSPTTTLWLCTGSRKKAGTISHNFSIRTLASKRVKIIH